MPLEKQIIKNITRWLNQRSVWWMKTHGSPYTRAGIPDLLLLYQGKAMFLEVKQPGKKPTAIQRAAMIRITSVGKVPCAIVHSVKDVRDVLEEEGFLI